MKIDKKGLKVFKIKNRRGFAVVCSGCLTEGKSAQEALARMAKAIKRITRRIKR